MRLRTPLNLWCATLFTTLGLSPLVGCGETTSTTTAGPLGDWVAIEAILDNPLCGVGCGDHWRVDSKGVGTHISTFGAPPHEPVKTWLSAEDLGALDALVDGPSLRAAIRDGLPCSAGQHLDTSMSLTLTLSAQTLSRDVTGCVREPIDNVLGRAYELISLCSGTWDISTQSEAQAKAGPNYLVCQETMAAPDAGSNRWAVLPNRCHCP